MPRSLGLYLDDILKSTAYILEATAGYSREQFFNHPDLRFAVERNFTIIGEALAQIGRYHPTAFAQIPDARVIVNFRNILVHGYATIDPEAVWSAIQSDVEPLQASVRQLRAQQSAS